MFLAFLSLLAFHSISIWPILSKKFHDYPQTETEFTTYNINRTGFHEIASVKSGDSIRVKFNGQPLRLFLFLSTNFEVVLQNLEIDGSNSNLKDHSEKVSYSNLKDLKENIAFAVDADDEAVFKFGSIERNHQNEEDKSHHNRFHFFKGKQRRTLKEKVKFITSKLAFHYQDYDDEDFDFDFDHIKVALWLLPREMCGKSSIYEYGSNSNLTVGQAISIITSKTGDEITYSNCIFSPLFDIFDSKSSQLFQSLFACDSPFPRVSKFFPENELNDAILSLTNDVLTKKNKSFIDIILVICRTLIIDGLVAAKDQECFLTYTKQFPDLRIISFLSEYESIKNEPVFENAIIQVTNNLNPEPNSISEIDPDSIVTDVMQRLSNDYTLCFFLTNTIGRKTKTVDLEKVSLPKYIIEHANLELIDCSSFNDKNLFVINDEDRKKDFVFIYLYKALCLIVNQIHNLKKNESQIDFSEISTTDSISEISSSSTDLLSTFSIE